MEWSGLTSKRKKHRKTRIMINSFALLGDNPPLLLKGDFGRMFKVTILMHDLRIIFSKIYFP